MPEWVANTPWWVFAMVALALSGAVLGAVLKVSMWAGSVNSRFDSVNSRLDSVDSRIDSLGETVRDGFAEVRKDIKKILERLASPPPTVQQNSPVRLSSFGEKISAEVSAKAWKGEGEQGATEVSIHALPSARGREKKGDGPRRLRSSPFLSPPPPWTGGRSGGGWTAVDGPAGTPLRSSSRHSRESGNLFQFQWSMDSREACPRESGGGNDGVGGACPRLDRGNDMKRRA